MKVENNEKKNRLEFISKFRDTYKARLEFYRSYDEPRLLVKFRNTEIVLPSKPYVEDNIDYIAIVITMCDTDLMSEQTMLRIVGSFYVSDNAPVGTKVYVQKNRLSKAAVVRALVTEGIVEPGIIRARMEKMGYDVTTKFITDTLWRIRNSKIS